MGCCEGGKAKTVFTVYTQDNMFSCRKMTVLIRSATKFANGSAFCFRTDMLASVENAKSHSQHATTQP